MAREDVIELMVRDWVRTAWREGKMFEFIMNFRSFWDDPNWADKYERIAKEEFRRILKKG